ncbi:MAG TPA: hypothetical protein VIY47_07595 [Ignavibacteriaceae bacterium]
MLFYFRKKDISEFKTYKHVNSIPKLHKQYDIKLIVILQDFTKFIAQTLNSFFSKLVNNEIRLYRTQPTIWFHGSDINSRYVALNKIIYREGI